MRTAARRQAHRQEGRDHRQETHGVHEEAHPFADPDDQDARERRPHEAGTVDEKGVHRDGVRQVLGVLEHLDDEGLARRNFEAADESAEERQRDDLPDVDDAGERQDREGRRLDRRQDLARQDDPIAVPPVGQDARQRGHEERRNLPHEADDAKQHRRAREVVDEPRQGQALHPRADQRDALAEEEEAEVPVAQRTDHALASDGASPGTPPCTRRRWRWARSAVCGCRRRRSSRDRRARGPCTASLRAARRRAFRR